jgi:hypothetical protein
LIRGIVKEIARLLSVKTVTELRGRVPFWNELRDYMQKLAQENPELRASIVKVLAIKDRLAKVKARSA